METIIRPCKCSHKYQDEKFGKGNRVWNSAPTQKKLATPRWRCTVCGEVKEFRR